MFTGIIQDIGTIEDIILNEGEMRLGISTSLNPSHLTLGASIACNGCCLTITDAVGVTSQKAVQTRREECNVHKRRRRYISDTATKSEQLFEKLQVFFVDIGPETLSLTRFSKLKLGDKINLEPSLRVGDALGGHNVSGHVDGVFQISSFEKTNENFWKLSLLIPNKFSKFMISKGSIALVGISLTIAHIYSHPNDFVCVEFMIIPHTYYNTILQFISANFNLLEVEFDQSTKTIASLFEGMLFNYTQMIK